MFLAVAEKGSVVQAAKQLHLTPSAVSHGLKGLESDLGCRLFDRAAKRILLNQAGEQLMADIRQPLSALDTAEESIKRLGKWGQTRLRIGASLTSTQYLLPGVIRELKKNFANLTIQIETGDMPEMLPLLRANKVDLALGMEPEDQSGLDIRQVFRDELLFMFSSTHPWSDARSVTRDDVRKQPLILYRRSSYTTQLVEKYFQEQDLVPSTMMEIASIEAIKELVKLNLGVSVLAPWTADKELARGTLKMRPLSGQPLRRKWVIASIAGRRLSLMEETFSRLCRNVSSGLRVDRKDVPGLGQV